MSLTDREKQVMNWSTQEIDANVKLGDTIAEMLETDGGMFSEQDHALVNHAGITGVPAAVTPAANQVDSIAADLMELITDFNALLTKLKAAGLMDADT